MSDVWNHDKYFWMCFVTTVSKILSLYSMLICDVVLCNFSSTIVDIFWSCLISPSREIPFMTQYLPPSYTNSIRTCSTKKVAKSDEKRPTLFAFTFAFSLFPPWRVKAKLKSDTVGFARSTKFVYFDILGKNGS